MLICFIATAGLVAACSDSKSDSTAASDTITVSGSMGVSLFSVPGKVKTTALSLSTLQMYCVAFNAEATSGTSTFSSSGAFSVAGLPADTPFGCFVVKISDSSIVATIQIQGTGSGLEDSSTSSLSLKQSVSLGTLTLTEGNPVISVPEAQIASAVSVETTPTIAVDSVHQTSWTMTCVDSTDTACASFVSGSPQVYFRIVKATKSSQTLYGLGVWSSAADFATCGSVDMTAAEASSIVTDEGGDFAWVQSTTGNFTNATSTSDTCPLREAGTAGVDNLQNYYAFDKLKIQGSAYTLIQQDDFDNGGGCSGTHRTAVTFKPSSATVMYGNFSISEDYVEASPGNCGSDVDSANSFVVKFTKI